MSAGANGQEETRDRRGGNGDQHLTWRDHPTRELLRLSGPIAVSMLSFSLMTLADTLFVGRLGSAALAGVGLGGVAAFTLLCFSFGLLRGLKVTTSQAVGAGRSEELDGYLVVGLGLAAVLGIVTSAIGWVTADLLPALMDGPESGAHAAGYTRVRTLGTAFTLAAVALRESRYGRGDSRIPMIAAIFANALNIGLDWLLLFPLEMGPEGAAWASNAAALAEGLVILAATGRPSVRMTDLRAQGRRWLAAIWRIGFPSGAQMLLEVGSFALLTAMLARLGDVEMASHQIALQLAHFSFLPALAVADAASVMVGQAVGADRDDLLRPVSRRALLAAAVYTGVCAVAFALAGATLASFFTEDGAVVALATRLLLVAAAFQVFDGAYVIVRGVLRGAGDVRYPAVVGIATAWIATPPLTWLLGFYAGLGAIGAWYGLLVELVTGAVILWVRLERGGWRESAARSRADLRADDVRSRTPASPAETPSAPEHSRSDPGRTSSPAPLVVPQT